MHFLRGQKNGSTLKGSKPSSSNSQQDEVGVAQEPNRNESSTTDEDQEAKLIEIDCGDVWGLAFLGNGEHFVSGGTDSKIRRWRVKDGKEVGASIDAGGWIWNVAVSRDGKWIVSGGDNVMVWDGENLEQVRVIHGHRGNVPAVDVSPDGTKIASGSDDKTVCVWSLSNGKRLLGPFKHDHNVGGVKFSPDGSLLATATPGRNSIRIYDTLDGRRLVDFPIQVNWWNNQSLAWESDSKQLFALSHDRDMHCLDVSSHTTLSKWPIQNNASCISLTSDGSFITAADDSSVSFWDSTTHTKIGSVIHDTGPVLSMTISANYRLATGGRAKMSLQNFHDFLPSSYLNNDILDGQRSEHRRVEPTTKSPRAQYEGSSPKKMENLEKTVRQLQIQFADAHSMAKKNEESLTESNAIVNQLRTQVTQLANSQQKADSLLCAYRQKHQCEILYARGQVLDAARILLEIEGTATDDVKADPLMMDWLHDFKNKLDSEMPTYGRRLP